MMKLKRTLALMIVLVAQTAYTMNGMIRVTTSDQQIFDLEAKEASLFRTIKDVRGDMDDDAINASIPLHNVSSNVFQTILGDMKWVLDIHAERNQGNIDLDQILELSGIERTKRAMLAAQAIEIPVYSPEIMLGSKALLRAANYLQAHEWIQRYAKIMAGLSISDDSLRELHENQKDHPLFDSSSRIPYGLWPEIYAYIPQVWEERLVVQYNNFVKSASFSPNGEEVITAFGDMARVRNIKTGKIVREIKHDGRVRSGSYSPNGEYVITASDDGTARITNVKTGEIEREIKHDGWVLSGSYSPNGEYVITTSRDRTARITNIKTGEIMREIKYGDWVLSGSFSSDTMDTVITVSGDRTAHIINIKTGEIVREIKHDNYVNSASYSPNNMYVITVSDDKTARITNVTTGSTVLEIKHGNWVYSGSFSSDDEYIITGSKDKTARITNVQTGEAVHEIKHDSWVYSGSYSPSGKMVITTCEDGTMRITERAADTFDQALLVHLAKWCKKNNKPMNESAWATSVYDTYDDKTVIDKMLKMSAS